MNARCGTGAAAGGGGGPAAGSRSRTAPSARTPTGSPSTPSTDGGAKKQDHESSPWAPNRHKIADLLDALAAVCFLPETVQQPAWIDGPTHPDGVIVACANGLLHVDTRTLLPHNPRFFNQTAVPFDYDPDALEPIRWLDFLDELWPDDPDSIAALQEFFGYVISGRLDLQKILLLVGPTRGGKGAIARVLGQLVGPENVAGPTLVQLGNDFGLAPLLGKPLAVISDARLDGRSTRTVVERLLAISGEDTITVNRKYRDQWTGKLPSRFMRHLQRAAPLRRRRRRHRRPVRRAAAHPSWLGAEDPDLEPRSARRAPRDPRLGARRPRPSPRPGPVHHAASTDEAIIALMDLASPVAAFVRDRCPRGLGDEVPRARAVQRVEGLGRGQRPQARHRADASAGTCGPSSPGCASSAPATVTSASASTAASSLQWN